MELLEEVGSPGRARTADLVINSHPLYRLSYRGIFCRRPAGGTDEGAYLTGAILHVKGQQAANAVFIRAMLCSRFSMLVA